MIYISSEVIANNVKNKLSTYFAQGSVDDSHIYKAFKSCLDRMGTKIHSEKSVHLTLENKQADLPCDFFKEVRVVGFNKVEYWDLDPSQEGLLKLSERAIVSIPVCSTKCDYCTDDCGNLYSITQDFELQKVKYTETYFVEVGRITNEPNIVIQNGKIYANFSGEILLIYLSNLWDGEQFNIPDYSQITDWMETAAEVECIEFLYLNGVSDVLQRLQYLRSKLEEKYMTARSFYKMNERKDFYDLKSVLNSRFDKYVGTVRTNRHRYN